MRDILWIIAGIIYIVMIIGTCALPAE